MFTKAYDLSPHVEIEPRRPHLAKFAETDIGAVRLDDEPSHACDRSDPLNRRQMANLRA
jgi:hypothetical protein